MNGVPRRRRWCIGTIEALAAAVVLLASSGAGAWSPSLVRAAASPFTDIAGTTFAADIEWLWTAGVTKGCAPTLYCPDRPVARGEMASFLARMFAVPPSSTDWFDDDDGTTHEAAIDAVAQAGITVGCATGAFCPTRVLRRDEMASFLVRTLALVDGAGNDYFRDDNGTTHEGNVDRLAAAGITNGCGAWRYCPDLPMTRGEMAGQLHRVENPVQAPPHPAPPPGITLHVATDGSDAASCLTVAERCATIGKAMAVAWDGDTIVVGPGVYAEHHLSVNPVRGEAADLTIIGDPGGGTIIDGGGDGPIFDIRESSTIRLSSLTITKASSGDGAVRNVGTLTIKDSELRSNHGSFGGAIVNYGGDVTIVSSTLSDNSATWGAGVGNDGGTVTIVSSTLSDNSATWGAGVFSTGGTVTIVNSTVTKNTGTYSAVYRDRGRDLVWARVTVLNSTVVGNVGGGLGGGNLVIANSLILDNTGAMEGFGGTVTASITSIPVGLTLADILDPAGLADNGGPTRSIALVDAPSNPAIGGGDGSTCAAAPVSGVDQRGLPRDASCDIGAFEVQH